MDFSRADGVAAAPRASATSRPCAQVSISRAVAIDAALIGGPNHSSLRPSATVRSAVCRSVRVRRHRASSWSGGVTARSSAALSTKPNGSAAAAVSSSAKAASSVMDVNDT